MPFELWNGDSERLLQHLDISGHDSRSCTSTKQPCNTNETLLEALEKKFPNL